MAGGGHLYGPVGYIVCRWCYMAQYGYKLLLGGYMARGGSIWTGGGVYRVRARLYDPGRHMTLG